MDFLRAMDFLSIVLIWIGGVILGYGLRGIAIYMGWHK
jgi:hypothetical protein